VKSFRYKQDAPEKGEAPDYDPKKIEKAPYKSKDKSKTDADYSDLIRLNRYIAQAGLCSRREADVLIESGQITVNGVVVDQMGYNVKKDDLVKYGKRLLNREKLVYVLLNKPKDFLTTTEDPDDRKTVMHLVENACKERIYPVGRLDRNTTGLLLITNDGELSEKLMHPSHNIKKIYQVDLDKPLTAADEEKIRIGVELEDGLAPVDELEVLSKERDIVGINIHLGRNRIVRRIFESLGYDVVRLDRVMYAGLTKKDLPRGNWRFLSEKEVINLKYFN
jgi:23S rRNA pseudouridine2605 synthase